MMLLDGRFMSFTELIKTKSMRFPVFEHKHIAENREFDSLCVITVIKRVLGCLTAKPQVVTCHFFCSIREDDMKKRVCVWEECRVPLMSVFVMWAGQPVQ